MLNWSPLNVYAAEPSDTKATLTKLIGAVNPGLSEFQRVEVATAILDVSRDKECKIPWVMLVSIIKRESSFDPEAINQNKDGSQDHGLMEINDKNIERMDLDRDRLTTDAHYNIKIGCFLLSENKKAYSKKTPHWIGVYNAGNKLWDPKIMAKVKLYDTLIKEEMTHVKSQLTKFASENKRHAKINTN